MKRMLLRTATLVVLTMLLCTALVSAQQTVKLTIWHHWSGNRIDMIDNMIKEFQKDYPWIEIEQMFSSTSGAADRLGTLLVSGAAPEILMIRSTYAFQFMQFGGFRPLNDLIERDGIRLNVFNQGDLRSFQLNGNTYALPSMSGSAWTNLMFYNKDMFNNAGLDPDRPPTTWTEWRNASRRLHRVNDSGLITQGGTHIPALSVAAAWNGAEFWNADWTKSTISNSRTEETIDFLNQLVLDTYGTFAAHNTFYRYGDSFWEGLSATYFTNNSGFALAQEAPFDWGAALAPVNEKNPDAKPIGLVSSTWAYGLPASIPPEKLEAAWLFLQFLTLNEKGAGYFAREQARPSPVIRLNSHPDYAKNPYWHVVIAALQYEMAVPPINNALTIIDTAGNAILNGTKHVTQALADADLAMQNALNEYWSVIRK
jgi:ABC-type glycerol-3-phosphate transport system substrate-binding protein